MKIYIAHQENKDSIIGTFTYIAQQLNITKQYVNKCFLNDKLCKGYKIGFYEYQKKANKIGKRHLLKESIDLLKRARVIIDEQNQFICNNGEYASIGIVEDIDRFLISYKI